MRGTASAWPVDALRNVNRKLSMEGTPRRRRSDTSCGAAMLISPKFPSGARCLMPLSAALNAWYSEVFSICRFIIVPSSSCATLPSSMLGGNAALGQPSCPAVPGSPPRPPRLLRMTDAVERLKRTICDVGSHGVPTDGKCGRASMANGLLPHTDFSRTQ